MPRSVGALFLLACIPVFCQNPPTPPAFDVAELKVHQPGDPEVFVDFGKGGQLTVRNVSLRTLIYEAYHIRSEELSGAPAWTESEHFDVIARAAPTASEMDLRRMLVTLLQDRLKLATHTEQKVMAAYALVAAKGGPKNLKPAAPAHPSDQMCPDVQPDVPGDDAFHCRGASMAQFAAELADMRRYIQVPVVDQTGIRGAYEFQLNYTPARLLNANPGDRRTPMGSGVSLFNALQAQLGLKLESRKLPITVIVVDHVERTPSEN